MSNKEKYDLIFINSFEVKENELPSLRYQDVDTWDSIGHVSMIAELEDVFDIMLEMDDILDFSSYSKGIDILKKYGIKL
jgi:acyl carrier protein